jgi:hypothetical protein
MSGAAPPWPDVTVTAVLSHRPAFLMAAMISPTAVRLDDGLSAARSSIR